MLGVALRSSAGILRDMGLRSSQGLLHSNQGHRPDLIQDIAPAPIIAAQPFTFNFSSAATMPVTPFFNMQEGSLHSSVELEPKFSTLESEPEQEPELINLLPVAGFFDSIPEFDKLLPKQWMEMEEASKKFDHILTIQSHGDRYGNIQAYPENQVGQTNGSWISLSHVSELICTCAPPAHYLKEFWESILTEGVSGIVMLTKLVERQVEKADLYWPQQPGKTSFFGEIEVQYALKTDLCEGLVKRTFFVKRKNDDTFRVVVQLHFTGWPDQGVPKSPATFFRLIDEIEELNQDKLLIHCSAGVGRTGTLVAFLQACREMKAAILDTIANGTEPQIDLPNTIINLRGQRKGMVQSEEQFSFCFRAILEKFKLLLQEHRELINVSAHRDTLMSHLTTLESLNLF